MHHTLFEIRRDVTRGRLRISSELPLNVCVVYGIAAKDLCCIVTCLKYSIYHMWHHVLSWSWAESGKKLTWPPIFVSDRQYFPDASWEKLTFRIGTWYKLQSNAWLSILAIVLFTNAIMVCMQMYTKQLCTITESYPFVQITQILSLSSYQHKVSLFEC